MKCPVCASESVDKAKFCSKCGYRFADPVNPPSYYSGSVYDGPPVTADRYQGTSQQVDRVAIYLIVVGIALGAVAGVMYMISVGMMMNDMNSDYFSDNTRAASIATGILGAIAGILFMLGLIRLVQKSM